MLLYGKPHSPHCHYLKFKDIILIHWNLSSFTTGAQAQGWWIIMKVAIIYINIEANNSAIMCLFFFFLFFSCNQVSKLPSIINFVFLMYYLIWLRFCSQALMYHKTLEATEFRCLIQFELICEGYIFARKQRSLPCRNDFCTAVHSFRSPMTVLGSVGFCIK